MKLTFEKTLSKIQDRLILFRHIYPFVRRNSERIISKENTICLFCQPRGGSTWLAEMLLNLPGSVLIDEPLWRGDMMAPFQKPSEADRKVAGIANLDFFYHQSIPEQENWPEAKHVFENILAGRVASKGLYEEQRYAKLENQGIYITKFCYAGLLMVWLHRQFNFKSILLTRHPCAVVASQLNHPSWQKLTVDGNQVVGDFPFNTIYKEALEKTGPVKSREAYLALLWALNFKHTAMHPENNRTWLTISYEGLLLHFEAEIERIKSRYGVELNIGGKNHKKPSISSQPASMQRLQNNAQLEYWKKLLSQKQISEILHVLELLEIDIYGSEPEPDYLRLYKNEIFP
jgi:hypothetical protein